MMAARRPKNGNWLRKQNHRIRKYRLDIASTLLKETQPKILEGRLQSKIQTALNGTENTGKTDTGIFKHRKLISGPVFQSEKRHRKQTVPRVSAEINPKNGHCLKRLDGKYDKWDEIPRYILNGKLRIVQNKKDTDTDLKDDDDDDDEKEEIPEEAEIVYDTSERDGRYENVTPQIHTDREITQVENSKLIKLSNRTFNQPNRYGSVPYQGNCCM